MRRLGMPQVLRDSPAMEVEGQELTLLLTFRQHAGAVPQRHTRPGRESKHLCDFPTELCAADFSLPTAVVAPNRQSPLAALDQPELEPDDG